MMAEHGKRLALDKVRVQQIRNGQMFATIPRSVAEQYLLKKGDIIQWAYMQEHNILVIRKCQK